MCVRRLLFDDGRGVQEPLDEQVCALDKCEGLTVRLFCDSNDFSLFKFPSVIHKFSNEMVSRLDISFELAQCILDVIRYITYNHKVITFYSVRVIIYNLEPNVSYILQCSYMDFPLCTLNSSHNCTCI